MAIRIPQPPEVLQSYSYDAILNAQLQDILNIDPTYHPSEGDVLMIEKEASSYRELHLRAEFNRLSRAFFLATATGSNLDNYALFYGVERLQGAKPTADYRFTLTAPLSYPVIVPKGAILTDDGGQKIGILLDEVSFEVGKTESSGFGKVELQEFVSTSDIQLTTLQNPLPYIGLITPIDIFKYGAEVESDESLRARILISMADKSTAGAEMTYKSYTYKADARIEDVAVYNSIKTLEEYIPSFIDRDEDGAKDSLISLFSDFATVTVVIFSPSDIDNTVIERVKSSLNVKDVRPLTDRVLVKKATEIYFNIEATIHILPNYNLSEVYSLALESLRDGLNSLRKIGVDITRSEINDFLKIDGVKKVDVVSPAEDITIDRDEIAIYKNLNISPKVYYEQL